MNSIESSIDVDRRQMEEIVSQAADRCSGLSKHSFNLSMDIARMTAGQGRVSVWRKLNPNMPKSIHEFCSPSRYIGLEEHWLPEEPTRGLLRLRPSMLEYSRPPEVHECFADFIGCAPPSNLPYPLAQPNNPRPRSWEGGRRRKRKY